MQSDIIEKIKALPKGEHLYHQRTHFGRREGQRSLLHSHTISEAVCTTDDLHALADKVERYERARSVIWAACNDPKYLNESWLFKVGMINTALGEGEMK